MATKVTETTLRLLHCAARVEPTSASKLVVTGRTAFRPVDPARVTVPEGVQGRIEADGTFRFRLRIPLTDAVVVRYDAVTPE